MQIDSDELWSAENLSKIVDLFIDYPHKNWAQFWCNYYVGPNVITITPNSYGNRHGEWMRAWRFTPGMLFHSHEPPVFDSQRFRAGFDRDFTSENGIFFDHMAYATEEQVAFKEKYYGYRGAVQQWNRLQENQTWPVKLKEFLPWVDNDTMAAPAN
jgi:hypothetical protein